jgi:hypothetical protein
MQGDYFMIEIMGSGVGVLDYDNDGDLDIYLVQSGQLPGSGINTYSDKLYRNDTKQKDKPIFTDVTKQAKIKATGYGMGVATGDLNNDGFVDIYVINFGKNQILLNQGDGTFKTVQDDVAIRDDKWSVSASIVDENGDGFLDIFVVNYVDYRVSKTTKQCQAFDSSPDYCTPQAFNYQSDNLFVNNKNGTFSSITSKSGILTQKSPGLGIVSADFNNDLKPDFYVTNDGMENHLWLNKGNDEFLQYALESGVAVNMNGEPEASMGVDAADFDNDGDVDLFMTHLDKQTNTLYVNNGKGWFMDSTVVMKLASSSFSSTGFGTLWFDYDNDGLLDIFSANGAVVKIKEQMNNKQTFPFKQKNQLWKNMGQGKYLEVSSQQDASFLRKSTSRGAAFADFDNDGDIDIVVSNNNDIPQLLINESTSSNNWIGIEARNPKTKRIEVGAKITVNKPNGQLSKRVKSDGSYASSQDPRVIFGLGKSSSKVDVKIQWLDGSVSSYKQLAINKYHKLTKDKK